MSSNRAGRSSSWPIRASEISGPELTTSVTLKRARVFWLTNSLLLIRQGPLIPGIRLHILDFGEHSLEGFPASLLGQILQIIGCHDPADGITLVERSYSSPCRSPRAPS